VLAGLAGALGAVALAAPAQAACPSDGLDTTFSAWGDTAFYRPVAGGDFESGAVGWTLAGGASIVTDHSKWNLNGTNGHSLQLTPGSSVTTPLICVASDSPTARMFGYTPKTVSASGSTLQVDVLYAGKSRGSESV
jgi:hypothetical protein